MTRASTVGREPVVDILDVGHGSCVVIRSADGDVVLIDAGPGGAILEYLRRENIKRIHTILVSHADADHVGGISAILGENITVDNVVWNGDAMKQSTLWKDLVYQIADLEKQGRAAATQNAFGGYKILLGSDTIEITVLAPGLILRQLGAGSSLKDGRSISSNTVSVVARVTVNGEPLLLVPGDLDQIGYEQLIESVKVAELRSKYLVLPHHGGLVGTPEQTKVTISALVAAVDPEVVFVSNGRGKFNNPRRDVVSAVKEAGARVPIACTQLSKGCAVRELKREAAFGPYSAGWARGHSCQGTTRLMLGDGIGAPLDRTRHVTFLSESVPMRICDPE